MEREGASVWMALSVSFGLFRALFRGAHLPWTVSSIGVSTNHLLDDIGKNNFQVGQVGMLFRGRCIFRKQRLAHVEVVLEARRQEKDTHVEM